MKTLPIRPQPRLGLVQTIRITLNGIRYRLFRSSVTMIVVTVAIAFMMNILTEGILKRSTVRSSREAIRDMRIVSEWTSRLTVAGSLEDILLELAQASPGGPAYRRIRSLGSFTQDTIAAFHRQAKNAAPYLRFFEKLDYGTRRVLVGGAEGTGVFDRLGKPKHLNQLRSELEGLKAISFPASIEEFETFLASWPQIKERARRVRAGWREGVHRIRDYLGERDVLQALRETDGRFGDVIRQAGFELDPSLAAVLAHQAIEAADRRSVEESLGHPEIRQFVAARRDILPGEVNVALLWEEIGDGPQAAERYLREAEKARVSSAGLSPQRIVELAEMRDKEDALLKAERAGTEIGSGPLGIGERTGWLILISIVVCIVGIANVMLIAVTERFREIATLKCLGALDGFIMLSFVMEAGLLGSAGAAIGSVLGSLIGFGRMLATFGSLVVSSFPLLHMLQAMGASVAVGVVLAALASVYPSYRAAKLPPMEAMRIE